jgi:hypothetical protein
VSTISLFVITSKFLTATKLSSVDLHIARIRVIEFEMLDLGSSKGEGTKKKNAKNFREIGSSRKHL